MRESRAIDGKQGRDAHPLVRSLSDLPQELARHEGLRFEKPGDL